ncbi:methionyl-tRNA formyltransferase [Kordiimonas pumila]|uniref:Methionyl-tRNA formyltransferase n=1 Tax=Kordiimonas pumila TaxID=2161677 RepID=A0ABV7D9P7_9PROT|nr:methionyl-tRNA formyltransferase [Kordiimonas pumila]
MRLAFMGTPDFAVPTLEALISAGHDIAAVYTQPPRPAGRGKKDRKSAVHLAAEQAGLEVCTPPSMKDEAAQQAFAALNLDAAVVVAYGQLLPVTVLNAPKFGCLNVHASLLPRWRGAAPIHRAIMAGDTETGVCIMQMEAGLDTGPVICRAVTPIKSVDTTASLHDTLAEQGAALINEALEGFAAGKLVPIAQAEEGVTYARKIEKSEAKIDWSLTADEIDRQVRGLFPFPGAWTDIAGERVKILSGTTYDKTGTPGTSLDDQLLIACGKGAYRVDRAQRAGKGPVKTADLLRGFPVPSGSVIG